MDAGECEPPPSASFCNWEADGRDDHPVNCVHRGDARAFAAWVGGRLPSEAEWEYAARSGGRDQAYPWGDETPTCERAVMYDGGGGCGEERAWPVCSKPAGDSAQGVCNLADNVWEWVEDCWHDSYDDAPDDGAAREGCGADGNRVARGGSFRDPARNLRASHRNGGDPGGGTDLLGFRPARSIR